MQGHRNDVGDQDEQDAEDPSGDVSPNQAVAEEEPVYQRGADLGRTSPRSGAECSPTGGE